jgi:hypothetical protein
MVSNVEGKGQGYDWNYYKREQFAGIKANTRKQTRIQKVIYQQVYRFIRI